VQPIILIMRNMEQNVGANPCGRPRTMLADPGLPTRLRIHQSNQATTEMGYGKNLFISFLPNPDFDLDSEQGNPPIPER
jgi:hypothetical protein